MKAIAIRPGAGVPHLGERPEPSLAEPDDVKLRVLGVGICGTDREEAAGGRARAADGQEELIIGHEVLGEVVAAGPRVTRVRPGDCAVFTVRRGCGRCHPCRMDRPDMCATGEYRERGIRGIDGYQTEYVVDQERYTVRVPRAFAAIAVLTEPLSVVEKAIEEATRLQLGRLPGISTESEWLLGRRCLVAGLGPVGLLAAMVLRLRGAEVHGLDVVDADTARPRWLTGIGGHYVDGREVAPARVHEAIGAADFVVEASGVARLAFDLVNALAPNGIGVLTGIPLGDTPVEIPGPSLMRTLVLGNRVMLGSVNAARAHFERAVDDLARARLVWGEDHIAGLITHRHSITEFEDALRRHAPDEIKAVIEWAR
jgi:threonine dehydrogenase-like Zn-dependent dehydrogenase